MECGYFGSYLRTWRERNRKAFEGEGNDFVQVKASLMFLVNFWCAHALVNIVDFVSL